MFEVDGFSIIRKTDLKYVTSINKESIENPFFAKIPEGKLEKKEFNADPISTQLPDEELQNLIVLKISTMDHVDYGKSYRRRCTFLEVATDDLKHLQELCYVEVLYFILIQLYFYCYK